MQTIYEVRVDDVQGEITLLDFDEESKVKVRVTHNYEPEFHQGIQIEGKVKCIEFINEGIIVGDFSGENFVSDALRILRDDEFFDQLEGEFHYRIYRVSKEFPKGLMPEIYRK